MDSDCSSAAGVDLAPIPAAKPTHKNSASRPIDGVIQSSLV